MNRCTVVETMRQNCPFLLSLGPLVAALTLGCGATTSSNANRDAGVDLVDAGPVLDVSADHVDAGPVLDVSADHVDSASVLDATADALTCQPSFVEAGTGRVGDAEVPIYHRALPACCPTLRGPAPSGQPYGVGQAAGCTSDAQCTSGRDGRCFPFEGLVGPGGCSYDQCLTDSDCPSGAACLCRSSASDSSANVCVAGGNCVLDSDCGQGGYCSPSHGCGGPVAYDCHTAADTCINDSDCTPPDAGADSCSGISTCAYDLAARHWACTHQVCCPP